MNVTHRMSSPREAKDERLLHIAVWLQTFLVAVLTFGCAVLTREARTFVRQIRDTEARSPALPPISRFIFEIVPDTFAGISVVALFCAGLTWMLLRVVLHSDVTLAHSALAKCHILAVLLAGLFGIWLILIGLCTMLPLTPWP